MATINVHGGYRKHKGARKDRGGVKINKYEENTSILLRSFSCFQKELDSRYDKREKIVKLNRDTTIASKRLIFQLHRCSEEDSVPKLLQDAKSKIDEIRGYLDRIAAELVDEDPYKFTSSYSGGIQEYVEAVAFYHFIKESSLLSYEDFCASYLATVEPNEGTKENLVLTPLDYILGVADLTGELMRMCINCIGVGNVEKTQGICRFLREVHNQFLLISGRGLKDIKDKVKVLKQSLEKVEAACYTVHVRGSEVPTNILVDLIDETGVNQQFDKSTETSHDG